MGSVTGAKVVTYDLSHLTPQTWDLASVPPEKALRPWLRSRPDANGEQTGDCPLHDDGTNDASFNLAKGVWYCFAGCEGDTVDDLLFRIGQDERTPPLARPLSRKRPPEPLPNAGRVSGWESALGSQTAALDYLRRERFLDDRAIAEHRIGWDPDRRVLTLPVFEDGELVNVRLYDRSAAQRNNGVKMRGLTGHTAKRLYPHDAFAEDLTDPVWVCEGEWDTLMMRSCDFNAVTGTTGAGGMAGVVADHAELFRDRDVVVAMDAGPAGAAAAEQVADVLEGVAASVVVFGWPDSCPDGYDLTDFRRKLGLAFTERMQSWASRSVEASGDDSFEKEVEKRVRQLRVYDEAQTRHRIERAREHGSAPPELDAIPSAVEWFAEEDDDTEWRIEGLVEAGHNVLLGGKDKVGKTTLAVDLVVSLTQRMAVWLDEFGLAPPVGKVGWINAEMTEKQLLRWFRSAGVDPANFAVLNVRGNVPNFLDPVWWKRVEEWLIREGVTFLVVDSLTEVVSAAGLDEDKDGVEVLMALSRYRDTTALSELFVLAHFGHQGERVRGTSKFGGWVDTKLSYIGKKEGSLTRRYLSAVGRDVNLPEGEVVMAGNGRLMFQPGVSRQANKEAREQTAAIQKEMEDTELREHVLTVVKAEPGLGSKALRDAVQEKWKGERGAGLSNERIDSARDALAAEGAIRVEAGGPGRATRHFLADVEVAP